MEVLQAWHLPLHPINYIYCGVNSLSMIIIKLGGSVVTDKSKPMTARHDVIDRLSKEIASVPGSKVIIHGGGSFGHIKAKEYELHYKIARKGDI